MDTMETMDTMGAMDAPELIEGEPIEPAPDDDAADWRPGPLRRVLRARALPWMLAVLSLASAGTFGLLWQRSQAAEHRRTEVTATADRFLAALTNFRGTTIHADVARIRGFAVGDFASQVDQFFGPTTTQAIQRANAASTSHVRSVFVESLSGSTATVFGVVDESVTSTASPAPRAEVLRLEIGMIETSTGWKVDHVDILQSPSASPFGGP